LDAVSICLETDPGANKGTSYLFARHNAVNRALKTNRAKRHHSASSSWPRDPFKPVTARCPTCTGTKIVLQFSGFMAQTKKKS
jgi:hypothetical protein